MTLPVTARSDALGNDSTATYPYGFKIFAATHLEVKVKKASDGTVTTLTYPTHFTVTNVGRAGGGNVVLANVGGAWQNTDGTLKTGYSISSVRDVPLAQNTDIRNQGDFFADIHEDAFDYLMMVDQRQQDDIARAVRLDSAYDSDDFTMTLPAPSAGLAIGWNATEDGLANLASLGGVGTTPFTETLLDDANAEAFMDTLTAGMGAETDTASGDVVVMEDVSAGTWDRVTLINFLSKVFGSFAMTGVISPTQLTANQNDYAPSSLSTASVIRVSADARRNVTGLTGGAAGRLVTIHNVGTFPIVFTYEDAASTAANRFAFGQTLGGGQSMDIQYDSTSSRWRAKSLPEPIGTIKDFGTSTMPAGFLAIDQNVSRTTYAALFNEVGTAFGAGDGSTTFGLFVGAGASLIAAGTGTQTAAGVDGDVDLGANTLAVASNADKWITGMAVLFNLASGTITGLTDNTTYYVIRASTTTIQLASSLANAQNGTAIDLTAKSSPVWDITHTYTARTHGERLGSETHAQTITEMLAHTHDAQGVIAGGSNMGLGAAAASTIVSGSRGGNAAMNIMNPSTVVTRGIRYC